MKLQSLILLLWMATSIGQATPNNWYVATNGTSAGNGSLTNTWDLQTAATNSLIQPGDTVWLRQGTYEPVGTNNSWNPYLGNQPGFFFTTSGGWNNLVIYRSYPGEWAAIDRGMLIGSSIRFQDLEFYDSNKGLNNIGSGSTENGVPLGNSGHFTCGTNCEWVGCVIHDIDNGWGNAYGHEMIYGCIIWYVGFSDVEHVCYPNPDAFSYNICAFPLNRTMNNTAAGQTSFLCASNIIFGEAAQVGGQYGEATTDIVIGGTPNPTVSIIGNCFYNIYSGNLGGTVGNNSIVANNVFVAKGTPVTLGNGSNNAFMSNTVFNTSYVYGSDPGFLTLNEANLTNWIVDYNNYYGVTNNLILPNQFNWTLNISSNTYVKTPAAWQAYNFDLHGTAAFSNPPDTIRVIINPYKTCQANIAVYNWTMKDTVTVSNVSSVLYSNQIYSVRNAQNYNGPLVISNGVFNGTSITLPMTNLTTAAILYGSQTNALRQTVSRPNPLSPRFAAFVVIGQPAVGSGSPQALMPPLALKVLTSLLWP